MLFRLPFEVLVYLIPVLIFALVFHEFSHAYVAYRLGDNTAERMGRLTLNPLNHLDPFGSLMILFVGFGWAKPVPVDPRFLRNPRTDMMKIASAGPLSNLILALISGMCIRVLGYESLSAIWYGSSIGLVLFMFTQINIALAIFNLIPLPPLDGSQIFSGFMLRRNPDLVHKLQMYGPRVLLGIILLGYITHISLIWWIMEPFISLFLYLFAGL